MTEMTAAHKSYFAGMECVLNTIIDDAVCDWLEGKRMGYALYDDWLEAVARSVTDAIKDAVVETESDMQKLFDTENCEEENR